MTDAMQRRLIGIAAILVAAAALGFILMSDLDDDIAYYRSPSELMSDASLHDSTIRLGGLVVPGTVEHDVDSSDLAFDVTDGTTTVHVESEGSPPQMFREGIGVVVEGKLGGNEVFVADEVVVKHSDDYEAPEDGSMPDMQKMNASLSQGDGG